MTDARLKGEWLNMVKFDQLSDIAWRVFTNALMWSAEQGTDGVIPTRYVRRQLHPDGEQPAAYAELEAAGIWTEAGDTYVIAGWGDKALMGQSTAQEVAQYKKVRADASRAYRERQAAKRVPVIDDATHDEGDDVASHVGPRLRLSKEEGEPSPFCSKHPRGSEGIPCTACGDARTVHGMWLRQHKEDQKPTAPDYRSVRPQECTHPNPDPEGNCLRCGGYRVAEAVA